MKRCRSRSRGEAAQAIESALDTLQCGATPGQVCDLADAFDAFKRQAYGIAVASAQAALERHAARPRRQASAMAKSLAEIGEEFRALTRFSLDSGCHASVPRGEVHATARLLVLQHGPWACNFAAARTESFLEKRDMESATVWLRIHRAIAALGGDGPRDRA